MQYHQKRFRTHIGPLPEVIDFHRNVTSLIVMLTDYCFEMSALITKRSRMRDKKSVRLQYT